MSQAEEPQWLALALSNFQGRFAPSGWTISLLLTETPSKALRYYGLWRDIYTSWNNLGGVSLQDPLTFDEDNPLQSALLAGRDIGSYTIRGGRQYLCKKTFPASESKWEQVVPGWGGDWCVIWKQFKGVQSFLPPRLTLLWWRFLQHNLVTGVRLRHMNPDASDECHLCGLHRETLDHLFWQCSEVRQFWGRVFQLLRLLVPGYQVPNPELGIIVDPFNVLPKTLFPVLVSIYGTALWTIWKLYLGVVFDGRPFSSVALNEHFLSLISMHVRVLYRLACKKRCVARFAKLWCRSPFVRIQCSDVKVQMAL